MKDRGEGETYGWIQGELRWGRTGEVEFLEGREVGELLKRGGGGERVKRDVELEEAREEGGADAEGGEAVGGGMQVGEVGEEGEGQQAGEQVV
jgi:hypothetical protein